MPKITAQSVPPELEALYDAITSPGKVTQGPDGTLRLKKGKKKPKRRTSANLDLQAFRDTAQIIATALQLKPGTQPYADKVFTIMQELAVGFVSPEHFKKCKVIEAITLESTPTSVTDPNPPPYGYRTTSNYPTVPTYPAGTPTANPPAYSGAKVGTEFMDTFLRWRRLNFSADAMQLTESLKRVVMRWVTTLTINAGSRGSRPMFSMNIKAFHCGAGSSEPTSTTPPLLKKTSLYWRFKIPPVAPPYFHTTQVRSVVKPFARIAKHSGSGTDTAYMLHAANKPMKGRGFNNNDNVDTSFNTDPELWEIKACLGKVPNVWTPSTVDSVKIISGVAWSDTRGIFSAVGTYPDTYHSATSPDGITWTGGLGVTGAYPLAIARGDSIDRFVTVGATIGSAQFEYGADGLHWVPASSAPSGLWHSVAWSEALGIFCAVGWTGTGNTIATSADGDTWTAQTAANGADLQSICWSADLGIFLAVAIASPGGAAVWSDDGVTWHEATTFTEAGWLSVDWSPELSQFIACGHQSGTPILAVSDDGQTWTMRTPPGSLQLSAVKWASDSGYCVMMTNDPSGAAIYLSSDFLNWQTIASPLNSWTYSIAWAAPLCRFCAANNRPAMAQFQTSGA